MRVLVASPACPAHFGGRRTRNGRSAGHGSGRACRWRACGCTTASGARTPIRAPWTWLGVTPHLGKPRLAPRGMEPDSPIPPAAAGSLPVNSPSRKGVERRFEALEDPLLDHLAVGLSDIADQGRDAPVPARRLAFPHGIAGPERPAAEVGMECTSQPPKMPRQASNKGGRSGHGLRFRRAAAAPEAVMQPQSGQRHTQSPTCTSDPGFRAHRGLFHMCGPRPAPDARPDPTNRLPRRSCAPGSFRIPDHAPEPFGSGRTGPVGRPPTPTGQTPPHRRTFLRADRAVHHARNRMMARTKRKRRSYGAGEWGRNRVRVFPDPKTGMFQVEWRENGRRLSRSLKQRTVGGPNHGGRSRKSNWDCTICASCR